MQELLQGLRPLRCQMGPTIQARQPASMLHLEQMGSQLQLLLCLLPALHHQAVMAAAPPLRPRRTRRKLRLHLRRHQAVHPLVQLLLLLLLRLSC